MKRVAVLTSGGDAPGMNAAIRAVTRVSLSQGWQVFGVKNGYQGLVSGDYVPLEARTVGGIVQLGGTFLGSARSLEFKTENGRKKALDHLSKAGIEGLFVIGGNGSQTGANVLHQMGFPVNGIASTIDNDLVGSDITIGVDTALNIALEAIDRLKVTASSHRRAFLVEVMGRDCGYLALMTGIGSGAESIVIPEVEMSAEQVAQTIQAAYKRGKSHAIVVVAEGAKNEVDTLSAFFKNYKTDLGFDLRAITLGHVQRGGAPYAFDRTLAARLGASAVEAMARGQYGVLAGSKGGEIVTTPLAEIAGKTKGIDPRLLQLADILSQ
ncbi:MAG: 6-phosphofructokinase [Anaerolinea sp.]|nr:6-phosphofructokinase [Anaerolinea sp.]MCC6973672.1 6-phosphofructokinase [Anaerolineae bacterium]